MYLELCLSYTRREVSIGFHLQLAMCVELGWVWCGASIGIFFGKFILHTLLRHSCFDFWVTLDLERLERLHDIILWGLRVFLNFTRVQIQFESWWSCLTNAFFLIFFIKFLYVVSSCSLFPFHWRSEAVWHHVYRTASSVRVKVSYPLSQV